MKEVKSTAAPSVRIRRLIDAPRAEVFAAWTDADAMRHWMRPGPMSDVRCELDVREGGRYRIVMVGLEGERWEHEGEYRVVDPPNRLVFTWISTLTERRETVVTVELFERGNRTELVITHDRLPHERAAERHTRGWTAIVDTLAECVASGAAVEPVTPRPREVRHEYQRNHSELFRQSQREGGLGGPSVR